MNYSEKLKDPRWQKLRLQVFDRDKFTCQLCGDKETTLNVHHDKYFKNPWDANIDDLRTLCKVCHGVVEYGKKCDFKVVHIEKFTPIDTDSYCNVFTISGNRLTLYIFSIDKLLSVELVLTISETTVYRWNSILKSL